MRSTGIRILLVVGVLAVLGIAFSFVAAWRSVEMTQADPDGAARAFESERSSSGPGDPIVVFRESGYVRRPVPPTVR